MIFDKSIIAVITARLNSKRLKHKNILKYKNKTFIEHTFLSAKKSKYIDRIIISTESRKIINLAKKIGCEIPFKRPKNLAKDNVSASDVLWHALNKVKKKYDFVVLLQPTSPLRKTIDIDNGIKKFFYSKFNSLVSIYKSKKRGRFKVKIKHRNYIVKDYLNKKIVKKNYYINGALYIAKVNFFMQKKNFFNSKTGFYLMPEKRSIDIDYKEDLKNLKSI